MLQCGWSAKGIAFSGLAGKTKCSQRHTRHNSNQSGVTLCFEWLLWIQLDSYQNRDSIGCEAQWPKGVCLPLNPASGSITPQEEWKSSVTDFVWFGIEKGA